MQNAAKSQTLDTAHYKSEDNQCSRYEQCSTTDWTTKQLQFDSWRTQNNSSLL